MVRRASLYLHFYDIHMYASFVDNHILHNNQRENGLTQTILSKFMA